MNLSHRTESDERGSALEEEVVALLEQRREPVRRSAMFANYDHVISHDSSGTST